MKTDQDTFASIMSEEDKQKLNEEPKAIRGLMHFMTENKGEKDKIVKKIGGNEKGNTFIKSSEGRINNNLVMDKIIYYKRMGNNKEIVPVYLDKKLKEKLDYLTKSPKYKGFSRTVIISAVVSIFLDSEQEEINKEMAKALENLQIKMEEINER